MKFNVLCSSIYFFENKFEIRKVIQIQKLNRKLKENDTKKKEWFLLKVVKNRYFFWFIPKF